MKTLLLLALITLPLNLLAKETIKLPVQNFEASLNVALQSANPGTTILMPEGKFNLQSEVVMTRPGLILKGYGMKKTILSFKNQKVGPQGILASGDQTTFEDFAVEDSSGNAIKVVGANQVIFRRVSVAWTGGPSGSNGAYGLYPVLCRNVLIENSEVSGASDAGVYVGQSINIIVRNNKAFGNVAGIEIENSSNADVYNNTATLNTVGILVFNLPDLVRKTGENIRVFNNDIFDNNQKNFAIKGSIIQPLPQGMGIFLLAAKGTQVFNNRLSKHALLGIGISHYAVAQRKILDQQYDPESKAIFIYNNIFSEAKLTLFDGNQMNFIIKLLLGLKTTHIVFDGIDDGTYNESTPPPSNERICIQNNTTVNGSAASFGNLHLDNQRKGFPFPGGPATNDLAPHNCDFSKLPAVRLETPAALPEPDFKPTPEEVLKACTQKTEGINWEAIEYDCPRLSDYNLFNSSSNSMENPREVGFKYLLNNQLFTDNAVKNRFVFLPPNSKMTYQSYDEFEMPVGTIITKTFSFQLPGSAGQTAIETRLLIRRKNGWAPLEYVWSSKAQQALLFSGGKVLSLEVINDNTPKKIDYHIPNIQQCASCHSIGGAIRPIGLKAEFLNVWFKDSAGQKKNQLQFLESKNLLSELPQSDVPSWPQWGDETADLNSRARGYLAINCAHCHSPQGNARSTGFYLGREFATGSSQAGACKTPVAAGLGSGGRLYDIQPGSAEKSILFYRMTESHLAVKMPQLGRSTPHEAGNLLVKNWINSMPVRDCVKDSF